MPVPVGRYLDGKTVLITGATGFLGKVVVERLLRCAPNIERIYLLIRTPGAPEAPTAQERFETEIVASRAFEALARAHGTQWGKFARQKLIPVTGDVTQPRLGLNDHDHDRMASSVDVIINAAASVVFDEPLDTALLQNTRSVAHVAALAREFRAEALLHVSTAFVAGRTRGCFPEGPLTPNVGAAEVAELEQAVEAILEEGRSQGLDARTIRNRLREEGVSRARRRGWHDSYTYTKALGEMMLEAHRGDVPTAVLRPTIIESSLRHPSPGWIENLNVGDPLFVEFGRGRMPDFPLSREAVLDMIPVDFVANALLAVLPRIAGSRTVSYYTIGSGARNPLTGSSIHELTYEYFSRNPMIDRRGRPIAARRLTFPTYESFREMFAEEAKRSASVKRLLYLAELYQTYTNSDVIFETANTEALLDDLHETDKASLAFDVKDIDWRTYLQEVHLPGLRRHVLREELGQSTVSG
jgi:nucleoside-diphosphate-sugar epimerase